MPLRPCAKTKNQRLATGLLPASLIALLCLLFVAGCKKFDPPLPAKQLDLELVVEGLASPVALCEPADDSHRLFVADQSGQVWIVDAHGNKLVQPFIDVSSKMVTLQPGYDERGLLGLAFHPNFKENRKFYLLYTAPPPPGGPEEDAGNTGLPKTWNNTIRVSEFRASASDPNQANAGSERVIIEIPHPQFNHNGGTIAFGPDGYLYISLGDGGNKNDLGPGHVEDWYDVNAGGNAQNVEKNLHGKILRIDINRTSKEGNYSIPFDNPFWGRKGLNEIYAYGFRNPYRFSFDIGGSRRLFAGDAGQNLYEEIDVVTRGGNYGWNVKEGTHCFNAADELTELNSCPDFDSAGNRLLNPVIELKNFRNPAAGGTRSVAVVGGHVYRGKSIHGLDGQYIFGSLSAVATEAQGQLFMSTPAGAGLWNFEKVNLKSFPNHLGAYVKGFGQDVSGEIYVLASTAIGPSGTAGKVYKLVSCITTHP